MAADADERAARADTERMFEHLYRVLREVEARPRDSAELLTRLLRDMFEPLEVQRWHGRRRARACSATARPCWCRCRPRCRPRTRRADGSIVLRFAQRGRRMFTRDDARLTDRVVEQLRRAVAFDQAVEHGRSEERVRIAQDLHDDIGARLLTLMYKAPTPEMEDYLRHTLKDLKTLTRGLAAADHRLSHAVAEWKADIAQRLAAAQIELAWAFSFDHDIELERRAVVGADARAARTGQQRDRPRPRHAGGGRRRSRARARCACRWPTTASAATRRPGRTAWAWAACASASSSSAARCSGARTAARHRLHGAHSGPQPTTLCSL